MQKAKNRGSFFAIEPGPKIWKLRHNFFFINEKDEVRPHKNKNFIPNQPISTFCNFYWRKSPPIKMIKYGRTKANSQTNS